MPDLFGDEPEQEVILAIKPTQRDANRATVRVGSSQRKADGSKRKGRVVATLTSRAIADMGLQVGQDWTPQLAKEIEAATGLDKAMRAAMNRLSRRSMSGWMVRDKLRTLGHEGHVIDAVIERLGELDLLDDEKFGRALIRDTLSRKPAGPALLKQKLYKKGIRGSLADRLVQEATGDPDGQREAAITFARKRAASMAHLDGATRKRRLYGQLARRGFDPDTIRWAMEAVDQGQADS